MLEYTFYVDAWLIRLACNFIFEYLLLWAAATVTRTPTKPTRLSLAALVGTLHYLLYLMAGLGLIPFYGFLRFLPVLILLSFAMLAVAFYPAPLKRLLGVAAYFYGIGFFAAGAGMAAAYILGDPAVPRFGLGTLAAVLTILITAEIGWGVVHKQVVKSVYRIPLEISCEEQVVNVSALVDTGNNLHDPFNRQPVIIVEQKALGPLIPAEINSLVKALEQGGLNTTDELAGLPAWQTRLRLIPFSSVGKKNGLMIGFRPDKIRIGKHLAALDFNPTVAIHPHALDPNGEYAALIPPSLVAEGLGSAAPKLAEGGKSHAGKST
ncbi:MAG TPA: sigma-E processing peptidase SpoIIGA [Firmicutes bacterium]|nr:sigma-E processing peptidase SpoIIGA [Bacillota bacterium]